MNLWNTVDLCRERRTTLQPTAILFFVKAGVMIALPEFYFGKYSVNFTEVDGTLPPRCVIHAMTPVYPRSLTLPSPCFSLWKSEGSGLIHKSKEAVFTACRHVKVRHVKCS